MKILTMCQDIKKGGFYKRYLSLLRAMLAEGWDVHYISTHRFPIKNKNLHFHKVSAIRGIKIPLFAKFMPQAVVKSLSLANNHHFDKIVVFGSAYGFIGWTLKKIYDIPMITFLRADLLENLQIQGRGKFVKPVSLMQKLSFSASNNIVVNISVIGDKIRKKYRVPKSKIILIHNNIEPKFREPAKVKRGNDIGFIGVMEKRKGVDTLLDAYIKLHKTSKINRKLILVGDGPMLSEIKQRVRENALDGQVKVLGWQNDVKKIISSLGLVVVPSISEGCPNTVLESLGCDTPCIGSDISEISEILSHRELLFKTGDADDLAKRISYAFKNKERVKELCSNRKEKFIFDWEKRCLDVIRN